MVVQQGLQDSGTKGEAGKCRPRQAMAERLAAVAERLRRVQTERVRASLALVALVYYVRYLASKRCMEAVEAAEPL